MSAVVKPISTSDQAYILLLYSKDCISSGRLLESKKAIDQALKLLGCKNKNIADEELLRLIKKGL